MPVLEDTLVSGIAGALTLGQIEVMIQAVSLC
jgi:hypothetical protein